MSLQNVALIAAQKKRVEMREQGIKPVILSPWDKSKANPTSLKYAIRAHFFDCVGGEHSEGEKQMVKDCALSDKCALHPHRPWRD